MGEEVNFDGILNNNFGSSSQYTDNFIIEKVLDTNRFVVSIKKAIPSVETRNIYFTSKQREEWDIYNKQITHTLTLIMLVGFYICKI